MNALWVMEKATASSCMDLHLNPTLFSSFRCLPAQIYTLSIAKRSLTRALIESAEEVFGLGDVTEEDDEGASEEGDDEEDGEEDEVGDDTKREASLSITEH